MSRRIENEELERLQSLLPTVCQISLGCNPRLAYYFNKTLFFHEVALGDQPFNGMRVLMFHVDIWSANRVFVESPAGWFEIDQDEPESAVRALADLTPEPTILGALLNFLF